ncbi:MAG: fluoride efflux transporter CrcB [Bacteroidota bacterium]
MKQALLVFLGGGLGSMLRYLLSKVLRFHFPDVYAGTLLVNLVGSLILGFLWGMALKNRLVSENQLLFFATGLCGGFTTFSTFAFEQHELFKQGQMLHLTLYLAATLVFGVLLVALGFWLGKSLS